VPGNFWPEARWKTRVELAKVKTVSNLEHSPDSVSDFSDYSSWMNDPSAAKARVNEVSLNFLFTEAETAELFADIALQSEGERAVRNIQNARRGYEVLMRYLALVQPTQDEYGMLARKIDSLRSKLQELGQTLP